MIVALTARTYQSHRVAIEELAKQLKMPAADVAGTLMEVALQATKADGKWGQILVKRLQWKAGTIAARARGQNEARNQNTGAVSEG